MCFQACRQGAHAMRDGKHVLDDDACLRCFRCADVCFSGAIRRIGSEWTADSLAEKLCEDQAYFNASGGGVTLSGGEVMVQIDFLAEVLRLLHGKGIHTAIETNLFAPWTAYEKIMPDLDLVMADIKGLNEEKHRKFTGVSQEPILQNARRILSSGKPTLIRTPVIPGFNDRPEEISAIARLISGHASLISYDLLTYHPLGVQKGESIRHPEQYFDIPSAEAMLALAAAAAGENVPVTIDGKHWGERK